MSQFVRRPTAAFADHAGGGLLRNDHLEICHVTNDIAQARRIYGKQLGIREFRRLEGQLPDGGAIHVELPWVGGTMYELLTANGPGSAPFMHVLPPGYASAMRLHHLRYFIHDQAAWDALETDNTRCGGVIRVANDIPGFLKFVVVELPQLGHYLEHIHPEPAGVAFFEGVPAN